MPATLNAHPLPWALPYIRWRRPSVYQPGALSDTRQCHDHLFLLVTAGEGHVTVNGTREVAVPGRLFYILPGWWYSYGASSQAPMHLLTVHFDWVEREDSPRRTPFGNLEGIPNQAEYSIPGWDVRVTPWLDLAGHRVLVQAFEELNSLPPLSGQGAKRDPATDVQGAGWLLVVLGHLMRVAPDAEKTREMKPEVEHRLQTALALLVDHRQPVSLEVAAAKVGWSAAHLRRVCRSVHGCTPLQWQMRQRMDAARDLLARGTSVADTARLCGYQDPAYFARLYRRVTGNAPSRHKWVANPVWKKP